MSRACVPWLVVAMVLASRPGGAQSRFPQNTYHRTADAAKCTDKPDGGRSCRYEIGRVLVITIAKVGERDPGITIEKSDFTNDFYATVSPRWRCITIFAGMKAPPEAKAPFDNVAYISPRTGRVFLQFEQCEANAAIYTTTP